MRTRRNTLCSRRVRMGMSTHDASGQLRHGDGRWAQHPQSAPSGRAALKVDPARQELSSALAQTRDALASVDPSRPRRDPALDTAARRLFDSVEATHFVDEELGEIAALEVRWARHNLDVADREDALGPIGSLRDGFGDALDDSGFDAVSPWDDFEPVSAEYRGFLNSTDNLCSVLADKGF